MDVKGSFTVQIKILLQDEDHGESIAAFSVPRPGHGWALQRRSNMFPVR
jgi:hypothetical protein